METTVGIKILKLKFNVLAVDLRSGDAMNFSPNVTAALASENKSLAHPASVDTIPTSANQEDHVSMAPHAGHQLRQLIGDTSRILAIELMCAAQARDLKAEYQLAANSEDIYQLIRLEVPYLEEDGPLSAHIDYISNLVSSGKIAQIVFRNTQDLS